MSTDLEIRDPVHGFIFREPHEQEITDTPIFQRLRKLKQLALATLVYPGAVHTRFDHSLGAFFVAQQTGERLLRSDAERRLVRLAALLHDIGHGPFSHVSEEVFEDFAEQAKFVLKPKQQVHEAITAQLIMGNKSLQYFLSDRERERIVGLLEGTYGPGILKEIVSGPIDVDKQDYLLRDSYFCGVKYGIYDRDRLTGCLRVYEDSYDRSLALSAEGVNVLEQFVLAKYYMSTQVYRHRIRLITDEMIVRGIKLGISQDGIGILKDLYGYDGSEAFLENYLEWNDERLMASLVNDSADGYAKEIFTRLSERRLFKRIFHGKPMDFSPGTRRNLFDNNKALFRRIEGLIATTYDFDQNLVLMKQVTHKSVRSQVTTNERS